MAFETAKQLEPMQIYKEDLLEYESFLKTILFSGANKILTKIEMTDASGLTSSYQSINQSIHWHQKKNWMN